MSNTNEAILDAVQKKGTSDVNSQVWGQFINGVQGAVGQGPAGSQLQVLGAPIPFDWGVTTGNTSPLEYWNFCNQLPKWSAVGGYTPAQGGFTSGYESFLNAMKQDFSQALKTQITEAQDTLAALVSNRTGVVTTVGGAYKNYVNNQAQFGIPAEPYTTWVVSSGFQTQLDAASAQIQKQNDIIKSLLAQQNRAYADAWAAFSDEKNMRIYTDASNNLSTKRIISWSDNPVAMTQKLRAGTLAMGKTIAFSHSTSEYNYNKSWAGGSASINYGFWGVSGGGAWTKMNESNNADSYSASITFKNLSMVTVTPDTGWFKSGYLKAQANGPFVDDNTVGFADEASGNQTYFFGGTKAILPSQVTGILVGYQPTFEITMSESTFESTYEQVKASGGLRIGPFHFGGSGGHTSSFKKSTSKANTIEGTDTSNVAQIFGVFVAQMPG